MNRAALRKLCDEATPKVLRKQRDVNRVNEGITLSGDTLVIQVWDGDSPETEAAWARFIPAAREALPDLLDTLEAVEAWRKEWRGSRADWDALKAILEGGER